MNSAPQYVEVLAATKIDKPLLYEVPDGTNVAKMQQGSVVVVPFRGKKLLGTIWSYTNDQKVDFNVKTIGSAYAGGVLSPEFKAFIHQVAKYNMLPLGWVLKLCLSNESLLADIDMLGYVINKGTKSAKRTTDKQLKLIDYLSDSAPKTAQEIKAGCNISDAVIKGALKSGLISKISYKDHNKYQYPSYEESFQHNLQLTSDQQHVYEEILGYMKPAEYSCTVLQGITGAGKTEIYLACLKAYAMTSQKQVLIMVPEIVLTHQMVDRIRTHLGVEPAIWHSELSPKKRAAIWQGVLSGHVKVVIGARSALFLPFCDLGLIVVDEEHDQSYKQEEGAIYQARDMAVLKAHIEEIPILLSSATPSLETLVNIEKKKYHHVTLDKRYGGASLPDIHLIDLTKDKKLPSNSFISSQLRRALEDNLASGHQSLLFLNRRGYAPLTLCRSCGHRFECPNCSSWMVMHKAQHYLGCHHCGTKIPIPKECPQCKAKDELTPCGPGVERLSEEIAALFPDASAIELTSDTLSTASKAKQALDAIRQDEVDIIIGTQLIAKGHHFPKLKLVGIVDADIGLSGGDLRASERSFQLLQQVSGRAGRETEQSSVYIQTCDAKNPVMQAMVAQDQNLFMECEKQERQAANMPPFSKLASIIFTGKKEAQTLEAARACIQRFPRTSSIEIYGPAPAALWRLKGKYRYRILIKAPKNISIQHFIQTSLKDFSPPSSIHIKIDIDPQSFL